MSILSKLFGSQVPSELPSTEEQQVTEEESIVENNESEQIENEKSHIYTIHYGTRMPIDVIYNFLNRNFESKGYDDAMMNADSTNKELGKSLIRNELKRLFRQVSLRYTSDLRDIEEQIRMVNGQGMTDQACVLSARKLTLEEHMKEMRSMEQKLDDNDPSMLSMIVSYERGFMRGLVAKSNALLTIRDYGNK